MSRFDHVEFDDEAQAKRKEMHEAFTALEQVLGKLADGRYKALTITALEEAYAWAGKAVRDDQLARSDFT